MIKGRHKIHTSRPHPHRIRSLECLCQRNSMSSKDSERPSSPPYAGYTAFLFTTVVVLLLGILIAQSFTAAKVADTPKAVAAGVFTLSADLRILSSISSELDALNRQVRTLMPSTVTVAPAFDATFTVTAAR